MRPAACTSRPLSRAAALTGRRRLRSCRAAPAAACERRAQSGRCSVAFNRIDTGWSAAVVSSISSSPTFTLASPRSSRAGESPASSPVMTVSRRSIAFRSSIRGCLLASDWLEERAGRGHCASVLVVIEQLEPDVGELLETVTDRSAVFGAEDEQRLLSHTTAAEVDLTFPWEDELSRLGDRRVQLAVVDPHARRLILLWVALTTTAWSRSVRTATSSPMANFIANNPQASKPTKRSNRFTGDLPSRRCSARRRGP